MIDVGVWASYLHPSWINSSTCIGTLGKLSPSHDRQSKTTATVWLASNPTPELMPFSSESTRARASESASALAATSSMWRVYRRFHRPSLSREVLPKDGLAIDSSAYGTIRCPGRTPRANGLQARESQMTRRRSVAHGPERAWAQQRRGDCCRQEKLDHATPRAIFFRTGFIFQGSPTSSPSNGPNGALGLLPLLTGLVHAYRFACIQSEPSDENLVQRRASHDGDRHPRVKPAWEPVPRAKRIRNGYGSFSVACRNQRANASVLLIAISSSLIPSSGSPFRSNGSNGTLGLYLFAGFSGLSG